MAALLITLGAATAVILLVLFVLLLRQLGRVAASVHRLQSEMLPILEQIQADSVRARERVERLAAEGGARPEPGPGPGPRDLR